MSSYSIDTSNSKTELHQVNVGLDREPSNSSHGKSTSGGSGSGLKMICFLLFATTVTFAVLFGVFYQKSLNNDDDDQDKINLKSNEQGAAKPLDNEVCMTKDCVMAAASMAKMMDASVDPCQDFAEYACGNFYKTTNIPDDQNRELFFTILNKEVELVLRGLLKEEIKTTDLQYVQKMKSLYKTCMNDDAIEKIGVKPFKNKPLSKMWPTVDNAWWNQNTNSFKLEGVMNDYAQEFHPTLVDWEIRSDFKDSNTRRLHLRQPGFSMDDDNLRRDRNSSTLLAYEEYITDVAVELGASRPMAQRDAKDIVDFQVEMAKIFMSKENQANSILTSNPSTLNEMSTKYGLIDFHNHIQAFFSQIGKTIPEDYPVNIFTPSYFEKMAAVVRKTNSRVLMNSVGFEYANANIKDLTKNLRAAKFKLSQVMLGSKVPKPKWKSCVSTVGSQFDYGLSKKFVQKRFQDSSKAYVDKMVENLKTAFAGLVQESNWMSQDTKKAALVKLQSMKSRMGYPDHEFEEGDLEHKYENHTVTTDELYKTLSSLNVASAKKQFQEIDLPVDKNEWDLPPYQVNAFYNPEQNSISFLAAILQPPAFSVKAPASLNYGAIGVVIGHEITHGFDQSGAQYDDKGNLKNWWQPEDLAKFQNKTQCIIDQYNNYHVEEVNMNINGKYSAGENAADIGGVKESYRAYKTFAADQPKELSLPGLGLTPDQQFFLSFSQVWCSVQRPGKLKQQILTDPHSPARFRIIGPLSDSYDFAKAYNCPNGSPMNPTNKCGVW